MRKGWIALSAQSFREAGGSRSVKMVFKDFVHLWSHKSWMQVTRGQNPNPTSVQCPWSMLSSPPTEYLGFMFFHQKSSQTNAASEHFGCWANEGNFPCICVHIYLCIHIYYETSLAIKENSSKSQSLAPVFSQCQGGLFLHYQHFPQL